MTDEPPPHPSPADHEPSKKEVESEPVVSNGNQRVRRGITWVFAAVLAMALFGIMRAATLRAMRHTTPGQDPRILARRIRDSGRLHHHSTPQPGGPNHVYVGVYAFRVPQLDLTNNTYLVDFWMWFRWRGEENDPSKTWAFMNQFEAWDTVREPIYVDEAGNSKPDPLGDGWFYQCFHVQTRFSRPFDVRAYPFDEQELVIAIEDNDSTVDHVVYVPDEGTRIVDPSLDIPGWRLTDISATVNEVTYATNFGDSRRPLGADRYTQFRYSIHIARPVLGYLATTLLPITIVMLITLVIFLVSSKYFEGRLGLGITSLISAVALQLTAAGDLPKTGYLVLLDHVYNVSYLVIFLSLIESVLAVRLYDAGREEAAKRLDRASIISLAMLYFGTVGSLIATR